MLHSSYDLLRGLKNMGYLKSSRDPLWWPHSGTFEVVVGALLTQQTKWEKVEESLDNLKAHGLLSLEALSCTSEKEIAYLIKPSGFYNTKALRLKLLCSSIIQRYGCFALFQKEVDREWLLAQKGIGMESADSILCYACHRPVMVVDSYTGRLLSAFGYRFDHYMQMQEWLQEGIEENREKVTLLYGYDLPLSTLYARFHGKIVEFAKTYIKGRKVDISLLESAL
ncbi:3-methyladenine DNA glycosylase [Sulfurovum sp. ST-21]|uniref:3-methyladenine DNA glycosylase n=1 Tax=Sulfurovum TaxID=265570 RepID=UPI001E452C11|nr:3-methyladenine DNA glycosylase [Sulfurovum indicum]